MRDRVQADAARGEQLGGGRQERLDEPLDLGYQPWQRRGRLFLRIPQVDGDPAVVASLYHERAQGARLAVVQRLEFVQLRLALDELGGIVLIVSHDGVHTFGAPF